MEVLRAGLGAFIGLWLSGYFLLSSGVDLENGLYMKPKPPTAATARIGQMPKARIKNVTSSDRRRIRRSEAGSGVEFSML